MFVKIDMPTKIKLYDQLCKEADELLMEYKPCNVQEGKCLRGRFCCDDCEHLEKDGKCGINSLVCKLWLCDEAIPHNKEFIEKAEELFYRGHGFGINVFRGGKNDFIIKRTSSVAKTVVQVHMPWGKNHWLKKGEI
jgi:hypothetical protein